MQKMQLGISQKWVLSNQLKWDKRFLELAKLVSTWSKDLSTKVGCVVVGPRREIRSVGYNGFPRGVHDEVPSRQERPEKYLWTAHAEMNSVANACSHGTSLLNCCMYVTCAPCADCAKVIIQSGIKRIVYIPPKDGMSDRWQDHFRVASQMLLEAGVGTMGLVDGEQDENSSQDST